MAATIKISDDADDVVEEIIDNVYEEIGIRLNKNALIPLVFSDSKEITDIVLKRIKNKIKV